MTEEERKLWGKGEEPVELRLAGLKTPLFLAPKVFSTGSVGWYLSQKVVFQDSPCQLNLCLTVVGTKRESSVNGKPPVDQSDVLVTPIFPAVVEATGASQELTDGPKAVKKPRKGPAKP